MANVTKKDFLDFLRSNFRDKVGHVALCINNDMGFFMDTFLVQDFREQDNSFELNSGERILNFNLENANNIEFDIIEDEWHLRYAGSDLYLSAI